MAKSDRPVQIDIPRPSDERPVWSRVGIVALIGFVVGILWPRFAGLHVGPSVPTEGHAGLDTSAAPAAPTAPMLASAMPSATPSAVPAANQETVLIGAAKITKCFDKKDKKVEECDKIAFEPIAAKKLKELVSCPSALGLEGKITIGFDLYFDKKEVQVVKVKKGSTLPSSTVQGILQCAAKEFQSIALEDMAHKHRRYTVQMPLTFYPPGKHEAEAASDGDEKEHDGAPGDAESSAGGTATVSWDTALLRKEPKDGDVVVRLVRGTKVKIAGKQGDWFKVDANGKSGWIYRGAVGQ